MARFDLGSDVEDGSKWLTKFGSEVKVIVKFKTNVPKHDSTLAFARWRVQNIPIQVVYFYEDEIEEFKLVRSAPLNEWYLQFKKVEN